MAHQTESRTSVAIHQPNFVPRLKVLHKIAQSDRWIVLDDVQFVSREYQNRFRYSDLRGAKGKHWFSIPVKLNRGRSTLLNDVEIVDPTKLKRFVSNSMLHAYRSSPHWQDIATYVHRLCGILETTSLAEVATASASLALQMCGIEQAPLYASKIDPTAEIGVSHVSASHRLACLTFIAGGNVYISGTGGARYLDRTEFEARGIAVSWQQWAEPIPGRALRDMGFLEFVALRGIRGLRTHLNSQQRPRVGGWTHCTLI